MSACTCPLKRLTDGYGRWHRPINPNCPLHGSPAAPAADRPAQPADTNETMETFEQMLQRWRKEVRDCNVDEDPCRFCEALAKCATEMERILAKLRELRTEIETAAKENQRIGSQFSRGGAHAAKEIIKRLDAIAGQPAEQKGAQK